MQITQKAFADQYDDKIAVLQQDITKYQAEGARLNSQAATLQSALAQIANQEAAIQTQINISQTKYDKLVIQIADTKQKIKDNQDALGVTIANMYVDGNITPIEMLASSKNISDYLDKQEYQSSIRDQLSSTITKVKDLKAQLDKQKVDVETILTDQKSQKATLVAKENEQQSLLSKTQGQEANYQQLIGDSQAQIAEAKATQAIINSRFNSTGGFTLVDSGSLVDYLWNSSNCPMWGYLSTGGADGNGSDGHGYGCRQCASYVAWRFAKETGLYPSWGNAVNFTDSAVAAGFKEGSAQAGSIAVMDPGKAGQSYGHVAWVESDPYVVNGQSVILVSQYNYDYGQGYGMYSKMILSVNAFDHYIHIK
jgi:surface antigen/peptidoglycan hydrolase CwlO-like protein